VRRGRRADASLDARADHSRRDRRRHLLDVARRRRHRVRLSVCLRHGQDGDGPPAADGRRRERDLAEHSAARPYASAFLRTNPGNPSKS
jgi:hypothetical protein